MCPLLVVRTSADLFFYFFPTWICLIRLATLIYLLQQRKYIIKGLHLTFLNIYGKYSAHTPPAWTALTLSNKGQGINGNGEL